MSLGDQRPAEEDEAHLPEQLAVNAKRELFLGHGLERAEVRLAGRACERVEAPDPAVHGPHGIARADVHLDVAGLPPGHDHVVSHTTANVGRRRRTMRKSAIGPTRHIGSIAAES
jgi:hypothetical protein